MLENRTSTLAEPMERARLMSAKSGPLSSLLEGGLLVVAAVFFLLHFVHLKADFPNHSLWMDWSKYTDEGWYGDAAIRHYQLGHWNVPGDFNAGAALPVWPTLELVLFRFTGVSLAAARGLTVTVFGLILACSYLLIRCWARHEGSLAAAIAVLLLSVSPFCFVFSRLAILEPLLILLTLAAMLAASRAVAADAAWSRLFLVRGIALGLLLTLMVLTKTTGLFLFPAIFWLLWAACGYRLRPFLRSSVVAGGVGITVLGVYYLLFVRPHYLIDYRYLFSANAYTGITRATFWKVLHDTVRDGSWMGMTLYVVALIGAVTSLAGLCFRGLRANPLAVALLLWVFGYASFLAYHDNLQPRYYVVIAVPLTLVAACFFDGLIGGATGLPQEKRTWLLRLAAAACGAALGFAATRGAIETAAFVAHPEYGWVSAAAQIRGAVDREAAASGHSRLVLSISGSDLALMVGLPAICDDFGTMTLPERVAKYRPGWFATWNDVEDDKMEALAPLFRLVRVTAIPAFDDPDRNLLILYRLDPVKSPGAAGRPGRRRSLSVPHRLRTTVGEQPSPLQLKH
jgi:4-amino-4-deoxy-L-arabinose transferase-like glycosyltransferase